MWWLPLLKPDLNQHRLFQRQTCSTITPFNNILRRGLQNRTEIFHLMRMGCFLYTRPQSGGSSGSWTRDTGSTIRYVSTTPMNHFLQSKSPVWSDRAYASLKSILTSHMHARSRIRTYFIHRETTLIIFQPGRISLSARPWIDPVLFRITSRNG